MSYTDIVMLLDRSGSMGHLQQSVIEGVNKFITDQRDVEGEARLSLIQFDDRYEVNYLNLPLDSAEFLSHKTFQPRGSTALLDALYRTIKDTRKRHKEMEKSKRPDKTIVLVFTDGAENASENTTYEQLRARLTKAQDKHNWKFIFLGANIDSFAVANQLGIYAGNVSNFAYTGSAMSGAVGAASQAVSYTRGMSGASYANSTSILRDAGVDQNIDGEDWSVTKQITNTPTAQPKVTNDADEA